MINKIDNFYHYNNALNFKKLHASTPITRNNDNSPSVNTLVENACNVTNNSANLLANYNKAFIKFKGGESTGSVGYLTKSGSESTGAPAKRKF